jgi:hypothetical protein
MLMANSIPALARPGRRHYRHAKCRCRGRSVQTKLGDDWSAFCNTFRIIFNAYAPWE